MQNLKIQTKDTLIVNTLIVTHIYIVFYCIKKMLSHYHYSTGKEILPYHFITIVQGS